MADVIVDGSTLVAWNLPRIKSKLEIPAAGAGCPATTDALPEGAVNLYWTAARFAAAFAAKTTTDLAEGTNLYFTNARFDARFATDFPVAFDARLAIKSTSDIAEGSNLYYTAARFSAAFSAKSTTDLSEGTNLYYTQARFDTAFAAKSTTNLSEGTNLYYTQARFDSAFSAKSTTNLSEGTNLYYTQARFDTAFGSKTTTNLTEGANLYYTDARARAAFSATAPLALSAGGVISGSFDTSWTWTANGIAATPTDRIVLSNTAAAISGTQQYSGAIRFTGQGFDQTAGISKAVDWRIYALPVQNSGNPTVTLRFDASQNGGAFSNRFSMTSDGDFTASVGLTAGSNVRCGSSNAFQFSSRSCLKSSADGLIELFNNATSGFTRLNFGGATSSFPALARSTTTLKAVLADNSGDCPFTAKNFACDGTGVGFNGSATTGKSSAYTVTNQTASRTLDVSTVTLTQLANVVAAVIADLKTPGLFA